MASTGGAPAGPFFNPWEPAPQYVLAPGDPSLLERIQLLVRYATQNGPGFVEMMKEKQRSDPKFSFLFGGEGAQYYRWLLYCTLYGLSPEQPMPAMPYLPHAAPHAAQPGYPQQNPATAPPPQHYAHQQHHLAPPPHGMPPQYAAPPPGMPPQHYAAQPPHSAYPPQHYAPPHGQHPPPQAPSSQATQQPAPPQQASSSGIPPEVVSGFKEVLESLTGSKDSIKSSSIWFVQHIAHAAGLARMMAERMLSLQEYDRTLHLIYLANDILFKGAGQRPAGGTELSDPISRAYQSMIGPMVGLAFQRGGRGDDVKAKLKKMLDFWGERGVFSSDSMAMIEDAAFNNQDDAAAALVQALPPLSSTAAPAGPAPPSAPYPQQQQQQQQQTQQALPPWQQQQQPPQQHQPQPPQQPGMPAAPWQQQAQQQHMGAGAPPPWANPQTAPPPTMQYGQQPPPPQGWYGGGHGVPPPQPPVAGLPPQYTAPPPPMAAVLAPPPQQSTAAAIAAATAPPPPPSVQPVVQLPGAVPLSLAQHIKAMPGQGSTASAHLALQQAVQAAAVAAQIAAAQAAAAAAVQGDPVSSFTFPPGLLPKLVKDLNENELRYTPLDPADIEREGLPPPPDRDVYLKARLDKFYTELKDYRPGMTRADLDDPDWKRGWRERNEEERREREREREEGGGLGAGGVGVPDDGAGWRRRHGETGHLADGSFAGNSGPYAGLGSVEVQQARDPGDMYSAYRQQRSSSYHDTIHKSIITGNVSSNMGRGGR